MDDIIKKVYSHYLSDNELLLKEKEILELSDIKKFDFKGRNIDLYYNENYFIKIDNRNENQKKYIVTKKSLMLGKFPKEIIINNIIRKELDANIVKINNYYFNDKKQILIMENAGITFKELIIKENQKNNLELINDKVYEIFIILIILQNKFKFMHKDLKCENILMKKIENEFNEYIIGDNEYKIKSHGYIPVFIDFATSTIFKIYSTEFEIYDILRSKYNHNNMINLKNNRLMTSDFFLNKFLWYIRDINKFNSTFDIYNLIVSMNEIIDVSKIKIIKEYFELSGIKNYMYSESLLSPYKFLIKKDDENLNIDDIIKNKNKVKIVIIINGLGNKLFALANIIEQYKNYKIYFTEQTSHHQTSRIEKKLKFVFPEIKNCENPKLISFKNFDILKNKGIEEIELKNDIHFINPIGFIHQKDFLKKYFKMNSSYDYLLNKYDFKDGIFVHVRYGDKFMINYQNLKRNTYKHFYTLLNPSYYIDNINKMLKEKEGKVYIFSDSVEMTKCLFKSDNFIYTNEGSYESFYCFTKCRRLIISESTISIAATYLNYNEDLKVIAPGFAIKNGGNIDKTFYVYPSTVTYENDRSYLLDNIKQYNEIIKKCNININKFNNNIV
jgi:hypothetical protein